MEKKNGVIYILTNPSFPDYVKIGYADDIDKRLKQLRELGLTISYYRKLKGLTQGQLASLVGLSRTHISNIEAPNIKTSISLDSLLDIAEALGIPVKDLFDFRGI